MRKNLNAGSVIIVTNLSLPAERVVAFYNRRGKAEQHIKEGKHALKWTRLSCGKFRNNEVRLQLHVLAYNLANFMRTLALPKEVEAVSRPHGAPTGQVRGQRKGPALYERAGPRSSGRWRCGDASRRVRYPL